MPHAKKRLWTLWRQLPGNLLPVAFGAPFVFRALRDFPIEGLVPHVLFDFIGFPVATWIATNFLGLVGNIGLKREMGRRLHQERPFDKSDKIFVGFSRPGYKSLLDPHEDVGFLIIHSDRLEYWGSLYQVELERNDIGKVSFRSNIHTMAGLGRWVCIDGTADGQSVRLLVEPRERYTLLGNLRLGTHLKKRLVAWSVQEVLTP